MNQQQKQTVDANLQFLEQYNLGSFRKEYKSMGWYCLLLFVIIATVIAIFFAMLVLQFVMQTWKQLPTEIVLTVFAMFISGVLLLAIVGTYKILRTGTLNAYLYEYGFIYCTSKGIVQQVVRWTDITVFRHQVVKRSSRNSEGRTSTSYDDVYTITLRNTEKPVRLSFGKEFAKTVESEVASWQYPLARTAYRSGNAVYFGRLGMWPQGLYDTTTKATLPWSEVESIKANSYGTVRIKKSGERRDWALFPIGALNNPEVLRRLIVAEVPSIKVLL